ncbi:MAG: hypothetical protein WCO08_02415 [Actinomycetes bacterium]
MRISQNIKPDRAKALSLTFAAVLFLAGCASSASKNTEFNLAPIPFTWTVPKDIVSHLSLEVPTDSYAKTAVKAGAKAQVLVYYTTDKGRKAIFMGVFYFPNKAFAATINPSEPPSYGSKVLSRNGMVLSIAGPQDSIFDPTTQDGKNIGILYAGITKAASYSYSGT